MTFVEFSLLCMASWRLASMLVRETGPWDLFVWIRERAGIVHDADKEPTMIPATLPAGILSCVWCCSMWTAMFWFGLFLAVPEWGIKIAAVFAISTGAILVDRWTGN